MRFAQLCRAAAAAGLAACPSCLAGEGGGAASFLTTREVVIENPKSPGVRLAGMLELPPAPGPHPAIVILGGSGAQDRDGADAQSDNRRLYAEWSGRFRAAGFAVLRLDDRGVGGSTGEYERATVKDLAGDAAAAVSFLRTQPDVDPLRVGFVGHSEGAVVAALAAPDVRPAFAVLASGPAVRWEDFYREQYRMLQTLAGDSAEDIEFNQRFLAAAFETLRRMQSASDEETRAAMHETFKLLGLDPKLGADTLSSPPWRALAALDMPAVFREIGAPILAIYGAKDRQVSPAQNAGALIAAMAEAPPLGSKVIVLDGHNHLLQTAETGAPEEYETIKEAISPAASRAMTEWAREITGVDRS
ncbi:MAG: alpha/beta hydrolase family protein [Pseudomonadota bacterium]